MIQRIQSAYLALAAALLAATWLFPVRIWRLGGSEAVFRTAGLIEAEGLPVNGAELPLPYHIVLSVLAAGMLAAVFLYGRRPRQLRVVRGIWMVTLLMAVMQWITCNSLDGLFSLSAKPDASFGASFYLPFGAVLLAILAERAIRKDEELVRSADRLR